MAIYGVAWDGGYRHSDHDYIILGLGLNVVVGLSGLLVLDTAAFTPSALTPLRCSITIRSGLLDLSAHCRVNGGGGGLLLGFPVLRLRGDYLAIVTLGSAKLCAYCCSITLKSPAARRNQSDPETDALRTRVQPYRPEGGWDTFSNFFGLKYDPSDRSFSSTWWRCCWWC